MRERQKVGSNGIQLSAFTPTLDGFFTTAQSLEGVCDSLIGRNSGVSSCTGGSHVFFFAALQLVGDPGRKGQVTVGIVPGTFHFGINRFSNVMTMQYWHFSDSIESSLRRNR